MSSYQDLLGMNLKAERAVISAMINDKGALIESINKLCVNHFSVLHHQILFSALKDLYHAGKNIDILVFTDYLTEKKLMEDAGGLLYVMGIHEEYYINSEIENFLRILENKYQRREYIRILNESLAEIETITEPIENIISLHSKKVTDINKYNIQDGLINVSDGIAEKYNRLLDMINNTSNVSKETVIPLGYEQIDSMLNGGLRPQQAIIIAARPAMGKTSFVLNIACNIAIKFDEPVAFFSQEMSKEEIEYKILSAESEVNIQKIKNAYVNAKEQENTFDAVDVITKSKIFIDDTGSITPDYFRNSLRKWKAKNVQDGKTGIAIIDYLQLMKLPKSGDRFEEVSEIMRQLKSIAKEMKMPILILSQLSRQVEQRGNKRPQLSDLRESGELEQTADIVMFIYRDEYYNPESEKKYLAEIIISKHRNGATGTIELFFNKEITKFSSLEV